MTKQLSKESQELLQIFTKSCRHSILSMVTNAQSGHPGGALSCIDYLSLLYTQVIANTGEPVIVSNGHISPAVYAVLADMGYIDKKEVINGFRTFGSPYEGHVTRHVPGVWYGTGPLGAGISAASGFALAEKKKGTDTRVFGLIGDGEAEEGQVYEMMNFAAKYKLDNFIVFMDYNEVQLSDAVEKIMPVDFKKQFQVAGWHVIDVDGHDMNAMWEALQEADSIKDKPILLLAHTIMGHGVNLMEPAGKEYKSNWHGKAPKPEDIENELLELRLTAEEQNILDTWQKTVSWMPKNMPDVKNINVDTGTPRLYDTDKLTDCRSGYGNALLDLAKTNKHIIALTADLASSVKTKAVQDELPDQHIECGIAEQHMVSCSGGLSFSGMIPFCSTFGAFMTSRAKDQARVNDINNANVKMVATHCGLSVGEDGPTHQAIDDLNSFLGLFNTKVIEPADANHCDRIIRSIAKEYGNAYVRMGRHKLPVLTKEDGSPYFDTSYVYTYGSCEKLREGNDLTITAAGSVVAEAFEAIKLLKEKNISAELIILSSPKQFDDTLFNSIEKTKKLIVVEDHNTIAGYGTQILRTLHEKHIHVNKFTSLGVKKYALSGKAQDLYKEAGIDSVGIMKACEEMMK